MVDRLELNRRGLPHFVVVDADITMADRAVLERQGLTYKVRVDESGNSMAPGVAPVLSAGSAADFSDIFVWGRATTDTASGTLYAVVVASAAATPTAAQIVAGTDAAGAAAPSGNLAITSTGVKNVLVRGLTAVTAYKVCLAHQLAAQNSNVVTGSFTTDTLLSSYATNGLATAMFPSTGTAPHATNQADPFGGTNAVRWADNNDAVTGSQVRTDLFPTTFFNGVTKVHFTAKHHGGAAWIRLNPDQITVAGALIYFNTSTRAIGTIVGGWTAVAFDVGSGWMMFSGQINTAGADVAGQIIMNKCTADNSIVCSPHNGTHIQDVYNIRITRV